MINKFFSNLKYALFIKDFIPAKTKIAMQVTVITGTLLNDQSMLYKLSMPDGGSTQVPFTLAPKRASTIKIQGK